MAMKSSDSTEENQSYALLYSQAAALSTLSLAAAAMSCEALKADVSSFSFSNSGGQGPETSRVARYLKVLLNDSKLVGPVSVKAVTDIPQVQGIFREKVNNNTNKRRTEAVMDSLWSLVRPLFRLGEQSLCRARMNVDVVSREGLRSLFEKQCPGKEFFKDVWKIEGENLDSFASEVEVLMGVVWKIVAWEAVAAFAALEVVELDGEVDAKAEKKEKKKKVVLGKGNRDIVQMIKVSLQGKERSDVDGNQNLGLLENWVEELLLFLDPKEPECVALLSKVKELVESNETTRLPKIPKGTRDFQGEELERRKKALSIIEKVYKKHGGSALETPDFELKEVLLGKYGEDSKLIYDLADQGGELLSLRYDLTIPFARYLAMNKISDCRMYRVGKVHRRDNPSKGRYREFYQYDFDIAGGDKRMADCEVICILIEVLNELNIGDYEIKLNHRGLLDGMLEIFGVPRDKFRGICSSIDKLDKLSLDQIKKEMVEKGLSDETADMICNFVKLEDSTEQRNYDPLELLSKLREGSEFMENNASRDALNELETLFRNLKSCERIDKVVFDKSLARGLDYYTGLIFEAVFKGGEQVGSIAAGGRYDNLIEKFGAKPVQAIGLSLGIERVFAIMEKQYKEKEQKEASQPTETEVLVTVLEENRKEAVELLTELWSAGIKAGYSICKNEANMKRKLEESKIPWKVSVSRQDLEEGTVKIKDMEQKAECRVPRNRFKEEIQKMMVQQKDFDMPTLTVPRAIDQQLENAGSGFCAFLNEETGELSIICRREAGGYELMVPNGNFKVEKNKSQFGNAFFTCFLSVWEKMKKALKSKVT